jgi:hypothetical protein
MTGTWEYRFGAINFNASVTVVDGVTEQSSTSSGNIDPTS